MTKVLSLLWLCGLLLAVPALAADWKVDPAGSKLEFIATFEKTPVPGVFKEFDARLRFDPDKPAGGSIDVTIKVTSADMSIPDVNKEIRGKDWFDVARGTLVLKGAKQAVEVPFTWTGSADGAVMEGEFTVKRGAFGIGLGEWAAADVIGADVKVKFKVKLRKG